MSKAPFKGPAVFCQNPVEQTLLLLPARAQNHACGGGHDGHGCHQGSGQAVSDGHGHRDQQFTHGAGREDHRYKDTDRGECRCDDRIRNLFCALDGRTGRCDAALAQADDVFHDDDGIVHQHADAEREAGQRHDVQREVREIHQNQRKQNRERDADADHDRRTDVPQEQCQNQNRQQCAEQHAGQNILYDQGDVGALVHHRDNVQVLVVRHPLFNRRAAVFRNHAGAGGGTFENGHHDAAVSVQLGVA